VINRSIGVQRHGVNQFLASRNIQGRFKQTGLRCSSRQFLSLRCGWGRCGSPHHQGTGPQIILMCLIMRRTPNGALVDRVDFATPLSLSSRSVTSLSALAPAQRAGAQRLCALARMRSGTTSAVRSLTGRVPRILSSRAEDFHLRALPKPCVNLSTHTAPDVRPFP
jgi:hypothetical protein